MRYRLFLIGLVRPLSFPPIFPGQCTAGPRLLGTRTTEKKGTRHFLLKTPLTDSVGSKRTVPEYALYLNSEDEGVSVEREQPKKFVGNMRLALRAYFQGRLTVWLGIHLLTLTLI